MKVNCHFRNTITGTLVAGLALSTAIASAIPLIPGAMIPLPGTTVALTPNLAGMVVADTDRRFTVTLSGTTYTGFIQDRVVRETKSGTLDFYARVYMTRSLLTFKEMDLDRRSFAPEPAFGGPVTDTDVNFRIDGLGFAEPQQSFRTWDGSWVEFMFYGWTIGVGSSQSTKWTYVSTNATTFDAGGKITLNFPGIGMVSIPGYEPG